MRWRNGQAKIRKWGNSSGIRLPKEVMKQAGLEENDTLRITVCDEKIVLEKECGQYVSLKERLERFYKKPIAEIYVEGEVLKDWN